VRGSGRASRSRSRGLRVCPVRVRACYEAGPTGFGLYRAASVAGVAVEVIAPGKTPRGPSDRVKTDRKDAELLARLLLAGSLTSVVVPPVEAEATREFQEAVSDLVFADLIASVDGLTARKAAIAERLSRLAEDDAWWPTVARLRCFRGVDTLTAFALHLELGGDWQRFGRANALSAWLGLTPSLHQSGESSHQGSITKTGSGFARRLLVESAWHYGRPPRIGVTLQNRQLGQPDHVLQIANRAQHRLHRVYHRMRGRGKPHNVTVVACARELACFLWQQRPPTDPRGQPYRPGEQGAEPTAASTRDRTMGSTTTRVPRPFLDSARWQHETGPWGTQPPHHQTGNADTEPGAPLSRPTPNHPPRGRDQTRPLDKQHDISVLRVVRCGGRRASGRGSGLGPGGRCSGGRLLWRRA
jgi:transposase